MGKDKAKVHSTKPADAISGWSVTKPHYAGLTETVNQYLVHIRSQVTENLLFSNRRERVKLFHDRMCRTRGSITRPLKRQNDRPIF